MATSRYLAITAAMLGLSFASCESDRLDPIADDLESAESVTPRRPASVDGTPTSGRGMATGNMRMGSTPENADTFEAQEVQEVEEE